MTLPADTPDAVVGENEHGSYCVPRASLHRPVARTILAAQVWESETLDLIRGADPTADIVHAGTFFGDFIPALAHSRDSGARVWAFEPNRENHACAQITILLNRLENVALNHAGLDASSGSAVLATSDGTGLPLGGASHLLSASEQADAASSEQVPLLCVDEVVASDRHVAAIQLDVEGHEREALAGAMRTIARCRPLIVLETLPGETWFAKHLAPLGYRLAGTLDANTILRPS